MSENCSAFETSLSALIDGELEVAEQLPVIDHLLECPSCQEFYHRARGLDDMVVSSQARDADPVPEEIWHRIAAESGLGRRRPVLRGRWGVRALGIAAAAILGLGLWWILPTATETPVPTAQEEVARGDVDVVLEEDRGSMSDDRFRELMLEVLRADRRYHRKMLDVMAVVTAMTTEPEGSPDEPSFPVRDGLRRISIGEDDARETSIRTENRL